MDKLIKVLNNAAYKDQWDEMKGYYYLLTWINSAVFYTYPRHFLEVFHYLHVTFVSCYVQGSPLMERMKHSIVKHTNPRQVKLKTD